MKVAFGMKAHSGWAALVVAGKGGDSFVVVDRRRIELVEEEWEKRPYHAAENLALEKARELVKRGVEAAHRIGIRELREAVKRERERGNEVVACAVLVGNTMPAWSVDEILSVHLRMHQAEGALFRDALIGAARTSDLRLITIPEELLTKHAESSLGTPPAGLARMVTSLGKAAGPPGEKTRRMPLLPPWSRCRARVICNSAIDSIFGKYTSIENSGGGALVLSVKKPACSRRRFRRMGWSMKRLHSTSFCRRLKP